CAVLRVAVRGGGRGGCRGAGHGVERVQVPEPRAAARGAAPPGGVRRAQPLGARADAPPGLRVLLDRPQARRIRLMDLAAIKQTLRKVPGLVTLWAAFRSIRGRRARFAADYHK